MGYFLILFEETKKSLSNVISFCFFFVKKRIGKPKNNQKSLHTYFDLFSTFQTIRKIRDMLATGETSRNLRLDIFYG
jgi:hypothetical protein